MNKTYQFLHSEIAKLVDDLLQMNKALKETTVPAQQTQLRQRIAFTNQCLDVLMSQLAEASQEEKAAMAARR